MIHDDASTDHSADIIRKYEAKYPDIIKPIYQTDNQYSKGIKINRTYQFPRAKGKYIACCEGDDYWCDNQKLQKQFDIMENNPGCSICVHKIRCIEENGDPLERFYPSRALKSGVIKSKDFLNYILCEEDYPFQTSSYFYRKDFAHYNLENSPEFTKGLSFGDIPLLLYLATKGDFIYLDEIMSHYRVQSVGSWNSQIDKKSTKNLNENKKMLADFDTYTNGEFSKEIEYSIRKKEFWYHLINHNYKNVVNHKYRHFFYKNLNLKERIYIYLKLLTSKRESYNG